MERKELSTELENVNLVTQLLSSYVFYTPMSSKHSTTKPISNDDKSALRTTGTFIFRSVSGSLLSVSLALGLSNQDLPLLELRRHNQSRAPRSVEDTSQK